MFIVKILMRKSLTKTTFLQVNMYLFGNLCFLIIWRFISVILKAIFTKYRKLIPQSLSAFSVISFVEETRFRNRSYRRLFTC